MLFKQLPCQFIAFCAKCFGFIEIAINFGKLKFNRNNIKSRVRADNTLTIGTNVYFCEHHQFVFPSAGWRRREGEE